MTILKHDTIWKWCANISITLSAIMISVSVEASSTWWPYIGFLIGHIIWTLSAIDMKDIPLIALNVAFLFLDSYAMYIR